MLWALLAAFLRNRPLWMQAAMFGFCVGLFVAASVVGVQRVAQLGPATALLLVVATLTGGAFYAALAAHLRCRSDARRPAVWVDVTYVLVWLTVLSAAVGTLLAAGGVRVAVFAIVPLVLLAPPAVLGLRGLFRRRADPLPARHGSAIPGSWRDVRRRRRPAP
jgi:hypothetical protein